MIIIGRTRTFNEIREYIKKNFNINIDSFNEEILQNKSSLYVKMPYACQECKNIFYKTFSNILKFKNNNFTCNNCSIKRRGIEHRLSLEEIEKICKKYLVKVDKVYYINSSCYIDGFCNCGE